MRPLLLFSFCISLSSSAQSDWEVAFEKSIPPNIGQRVKMPERRWSSPIEDAVSGQINRRTFTITSDSVYRIFFSEYRFTKDSIAKYKPDPGSFLHKLMIQYQRDSLPVIDFSKYDLVLYSACAQCLAICEPRNGVYGPCHRNVCMYRDAWFIQQKFHAGLRQAQAPTSDNPLRRREKLLYDTTCKWISLPKVYSSDLKKGAKKVSLSGKLIVDNDSDYYRVFHQYHRDSLPIIDFSLYELRVHKACVYCGRGDVYNGEPRHRNACSYFISWCIVPKRPLWGSRGGATIAATRLVLAKPLRIR